MTEQKTNNSVGSLFDLEHRIIVENGKHIVICCHHLCNLEGISEEDYVKQKERNESHTSNDLSE